MMNILQIGNNAIPVRKNPIFPDTYIHMFLRQKKL